MPTRHQSIRAAQDHLRSAVWPVLRDVARPHPLLGFDFDNFIADFAGSDRCAAALRAQPCYQTAEVVFVTPDESTEPIRRDVLADGKTLVVTTYGIADGFRVVTPRDVPDGGPVQAATIPWITEQAPRASLRELAGADIDCLVTGAGAVTTAGVRLGKGHGYFDLEWAMLSEVGALAADPTVVGIVHDCQVLDLAVPVADHDVALDVIVTPSGATPCHIDRRPGRIDWSLLTTDRAMTMPPLVELALLQCGVAADPPTNGTDIEEPR